MFWFACGFNYISFPIGVCGFIRGGQTEGRVKPDSVLVMVGNKVDVMMCNLSDFNQSIS